MFRNLLAGLANSVLSALIALAVIPLYLKYLGIEAYGLVGFFATMQAVLQIFDMGLAPTINREVARHSATGKLHEVGKLLHTLAVVYWCMALLIAVLIIALSPLIAKYWLQSEIITPKTIEHSVMLMGLIMACHWPIALYQGALIGAQRLTLSSSVNILMSTLGSFGAVAILAFVSPTIQAFFLWQAGVGLVHVSFMRWGAWWVVGKSKDVRFDVVELKRIWRFAAGMIGISFTGLMFNQLDKVILSKMLGLKEFGFYMLATVVVSGLYVLVIPMFNTVYPRFSALVFTGDTEKLTDLYRLSTRMLATVLFPIAMLLVVYAEDLVYIWTGNPSIAISVAPLISLLAIGSALHGVMYFPYALQLAYGMTRLPLTINGILLTVLVPLIVFLVLKYGALGGAVAWLILHILYVVLGTWLTHCSLLKGEGGRWLFQDVGVPLALSFLLGLVGYYATQNVGCSAYVKLISGTVLALVASSLSFLLSPKLRVAVMSKFGMSIKA